MVQVYVIEALSDGTRYTGMALNATARLADHNNGKNRFTKGHRPWKILYTEQCKDWSEGRVREKYLKTSGGKNGCRKRLLHGGDMGSLPA
ncbi:MAG: GIY-YIG nuclease family protein [Saprospiraceae bacterium]|nr:GIY-YIG nuclease family protein [Saprospiraceae bacterium]